MSHRYKKGDLLIVETICSSDMDKMTTTEIAVSTEAFREKELEPRLDVNGDVRVKSTLWVVNEDKDKKFQKALASPLLALARAAIAMDRYWSCTICSA